MKKILLPLIIVIAVIAAALALRQSPSQYGAHSGKLKIGATIFALSDIARAIGGDQVTVVNILPAGASPHTFEPAPSAIRSLQNAPVVFAIGHELDNWVADIAESISGLETYVVDANIRLRSFEDKHVDEHMDENEEHDEAENHEHTHGELDPHYWLAIPNAKIIAQNMANKLAELDPEHAQEYQMNLANYQNELTLLETELNQKIAPFYGREIITFHNAWYYFADALNLSIAGVFVPAPGKEPTPKYLESLYRTAQAHNITTIFSEPGLSTETLEPFLSDLGLSTRLLNPVTGGGPKDSFIAVMRYNVDTIINALNE